MMIIKHIKEQYVTKPEIPDIEMIGARLEHHKWKFSVHNTFLCDCGDNWGVEMMYDCDYENTIKAHAPTLRRALSEALDLCEERIKELTL